MEVDPILEKDQSKFDRIAMKCITGENETERVHSISFDSIETEWDAYMRSPRSLNGPGFETLSFWKMESDRYPKLSKVARVVFASLFQQQVLHARDLSVSSETRLGFADTDYLH
jgi:hypothetical protein